MKITQKIAHRSNYGIMRSVKSIKYIVIHYTANDGDKSYNNANYFQTHSNLNASAHYFVDDNNVYQSVEDNYIAYSVGGSKWADCNKTGGGRLYNKATNKNTLNIELCDTVKDGSYNATQATINLAIELTKELMQKYNIPAENVIRHFDVNGKHCPAYWMDNNKWEQEFHSKLELTEGWVQDEISWWYQYSDGSYPKSEWKVIDGKWYYFKADGYMAHDEYIKASDYATTYKLYWVSTNGDWNNKSYRWMQNEVGWWITEIGGEWYPKAEWAKIDDKWYYFDKRGYMLAGITIVIKGKQYTFDKDGVCKTKGD